MHSFRATLTSMLITGLAALSLAVGATTAVAATGTGADFAPSVRPSELHLNRAERGMITTIHWRGPQRYRMLQWVDIDPVDDRLVLDVFGSTSILGSGFPGALRNVVTTANDAQVAPDGWSSLDSDLMMYAWPLVARVRSGGAPLVATTVNGRAVIRGRVALAANDCAGLAAGVRVVDLDASTLVPTRIVDRRGRLIEFSSTISNRRPRATDFAALNVIGRRTSRDESFVPQTLAAADVAATWPLALPAALPTGFTLSKLGTAPLSGYLGPEGSFPRSRGVFFAKWTLGLEAIDFTSRPARSTLTRDWDQSDPFGSECEHAPSSDVAIGANTGHYAMGEIGSPRLWWRDGTTLYTLSGPFSAEQLADVARSLAPVAG